MSKPIEELEEEILQLKHLLYMQPLITEIGNISSGLNLTKQQAKIVLLLYKAKNNWLPKERIEMIFRENCALKSVEVQISKIRKIIGKDCIETIKGVGYKLTSVGIEKCQKVLED